MPPAASANLMITGNESRGHVPPNSAPHGQFLGQVSAIGHFGTGQNAYPAPMAPQQPTEVGPRAGVWGPRNTEMSPEHSASSVSGTDLQFPKAGEMSAGSEMRSPRLDPRTKYSHFKIKSKGSPTLSHNPPSGGSGAASILKKNELFSRDQSSISGSDNPATSAPMPKLLQNRENLEKPLDPRELFGAGAKEVPSDYGMAGHFGSGFGTYFSRSLESSEKLPFGEITMPEPKKESDAEGDEMEKVETKSEKEPTDKDSTEQRKVEVPSYMAELGLGESGLTIDSAFSSLDKKDQEAENEAQKQKSLDAAKKLPSIFSFSSSSA